MCQSKTSKPAQAPVDRKGFKSDGTHWASSYDPYDKSVPLPSKAQIKAAIPKEVRGEEDHYHTKHFHSNSSSSLSSLSTLTVL